MQDIHPPGPCVCAASAGAVMFLLALPLAHAGGAAAPAGTATVSDAPTGGNEAQGQLAEVIVTAEKRAQSSQSLPAAISVISGDTLAQQGIIDPRGLTQIVPSLVISTAGNDPALFFRGVGQTNAQQNTDAGVAVTANGFALPRQFILSSMFDIVRVEALPGPQGTLYGTNSIGGIISYVTKLPTDRLAAEASLEGGNYGAVHAFVAADTPLSDSLTARTAVDYQRHEGWYSDGLDDQNSLSYRETVRYSPTDNFNATVFLGGFRERGLNVGYQNNPYFVASNPWYLPADGHVGTPRDNNGYSASAIIEYHFSGLTLSYLPSWMYVNNQYGAPSYLQAVSISESAHQVTNELRLSNDAAGPSRWIAGLYQYRDTSPQALNILLYPSIPNIYIHNPVDEVENIYAAFGQYSYSVRPSLRLTGGMRYSWNEKQGGGGTDVSAILPTVTIPVVSERVSGFSHMWRHFDWKAGMEMDVAKGSMLYANVATGFLNGGFGLPPFAPGESKVIQPETLLGYTIGSKNRFLDNRLQLNNEAFYYDYHDYQVSSIYIATGSTAYLNARTARIYGDQLDSIFAITADDELTLSVAYLNAKAKDFNLVPLGGSGNFSGYQLPNAPYVTASAALNHTWRLPAGNTLQGAVHTSYSSGDWVTYDHHAGTHQDKYTRTDLMLTYYPANHDNWSLGLFVRNVENTASFQYAITGSIPGPSSVFLDPPRTYGARISYNFGK
jgi:iron complex outermembrane recepter protein